MSPPAATRYDCTNSEVSAGAVARTGLLLKYIAGELVCNDAAAAVACAQISGSG